MQQNRVVGDISDTQKAETGGTTVFTESSGVSPISFPPKASVKPSLSGPSDLHAGLRNGAYPWHPGACQVPVN